LFPLFFFLSVYILLFLTCVWRKHSFVYSKLCFSKRLSSFKCVHCQMVSQEKNLTLSLGVNLFFYLKMIFSFPKLYFLKDYCKTQINPFYLSLYIENDKLLVEPTYLNEFLWSIKVMRWTRLIIRHRYIIRHASVVFKSFL